MLSDYIKDCIFELRVKDLKDTNDTSFFPQILRGKVCERKLPTMSIALWIFAYILIGLLLLITFVYVGILSYKTYLIRRDNRKTGYNYGFIIGTPSEGDGPTSAKDTPPSPKRLEASVKPPTVPPYSGKTL